MTEQARLDARSIAVRPVGKPSDRGPSGTAPQALAAPPLRQRLAAHAVRWLPATALWQAFRLSPADADALQRLDRGSERIAALARLFVVAFLASVAVMASWPSTLNSVLLEGFLTANLAVSAAAVAVMQKRQPTVWLSWAAGLLDTAIPLWTVLITSQGELQGRNCYFSARVAAWGIVLAFGLSALRGRPLLLGLQTILFVIGLLIMGEPAQLTPVLHAQLPDTLVPTCRIDQSTVRVTVVALAGIMLLVASLRARLTLHAAVVAGRKATKLSRYFAPSVASVVVEGDIAFLREGRHQNVAVLFADLRGFTTLTETLPPRETAAFLAHFRQLAAMAIEEEGGVIDKFIGDEVMGLFGVPRPTSCDAAKALRAARYLLASVEAWSLERLRAGLSPVAVGIGVHYGPVFVGVVGRDRLEFTVLGNTVNTARRLEQMTKVLGADCIASTWTVRSAGTDARAALSRGLGSHILRGQSGPMRLTAIRTSPRLFGPRAMIAKPRS